MRRPHRLRSSRISELLMSMPTVAIASTPDMIQDTKATCWATDTRLPQYMLGKVAPHYPVPMIPLNVVWPDDSMTYGYKGMLFIEDIAVPDDPTIVCCWDFYPGPDDPWYGKYQACYPDKRSAWYKKHGAWGIFIALFMCFFLSSARVEACNGCVVSADYGVRSVPSVRIPEYPRHMRIIPRVTPPDAFNKRHAPTPYIYINGWPAEGLNAASKVLQPEPQHFWKLRKRPATPAHKPAPWWHYGVMISGVGLLLAAVGYSRWRVLG